MKERRNIIIIVTFVLSIALVAAVYHMRNHKTPDTQEPVSDLNAQTLDAFKDRFNRAASEQRIILLLSPT